MAMPTTTARRVFELAIGLIDEVDENTGETDTSDTKAYKARTLLILNALRGELYSYSDTFTPGAEGRPIAPVIQSLDDVIQLDDYICQTVMPYGLAAQLLLDENPTSASFFQQRYEDLKNNLGRGYPAKSEAIVDLYGVTGAYDHFSRW